MAEHTKIEWCDATFNPWIGCTKVSPGCDHCYAECSTPARTLQVNWGPGAPRRRTSVSNWELPKRWNAQADAFMAQHGRRQRVFCASLADVFDNAVDREWRDDLATLILNTPDLDWLLLTKRIGNAGAMLGQMFLDGPPDNLWLGATIVNQPEADRDIPKLLAVPAAKRFLSMEPLLGPVQLTSSGFIPADEEGPVRIGYMAGPDDGKSSLWPTPEQALGRSGLHWVIVGGESGPGARPMHPDWARSLRDQCEAAGVPFLFKQWGEWADMGAAGLGASGPVTNRAGDVKDWMRQAVTFTDGGKAAVQAHSWTAHATDLMYRVGKKAAGRLLDGITHDGYPAA